MNALATFAKYGVWLMWACLAVMAVGSAWLLWRVIAHAAAAVRRRRIPRIPAPKPLKPLDHRRLVVRPWTPRDARAQARLDRINARLDADARAQFYEIVAQLNDTNTTDH